MHRLNDSMPRLQDYNTHYAQVRNVKQRSTRARAVAAAGYLVSVELVSLPNPVETMVHVTKNICSSWTHLAYNLNKGVPFLAAQQYSQWVVLHPLLMTIILALTMHQFVVIVQNSLNFAQ